MSLQLVVPQNLIPEPSLKELFLAQQEFHTKFEIPKNADTKELYISLVEEEHEEWIEDYYNIESPEFKELKELTDLLYVTAGLSYQLSYTPEKASMYKKTKHYDMAITDLVSEIASGNITKPILSNLMYVIIGYATAMNWDIYKAYERVHKSNLSKLDDNGKVLRREDGKVLKGHNYKPPFLEDLTNGK